MKCHYEILDISREADDSEIKTAYRKLALKWHPDKNLDNVEYAKEQFQLVQQAYEILSDRQERAWYDKHRDQILRGSDSNYKDNSLDVFQYFTTTCFKGYGDDEKGFYNVYGKVFEQISKEDFDHVDEIYDIPYFGNSQSDYDQVVGPFYDYWMSYSTKRSYVWLDPHDIKEATNRKIFKLIEKENDKIRQKAKKERNEEVRSLVAFVRKRDKRVQAHIKDLELKKIQNREKQKKLSKERRLERIKQLNESSEQAEWMKFDNVKTELEELEKKLAEQFGDEVTDSEEDLEIEDINCLYCVACNKVFKTPKAFKNHESSKRHKENIENLKDIMIEEDQLQEDAEEENAANDSLIDSSNEELLDDEEQIFEDKSKKKKKKSKNIAKITEYNSDEEINNSLLKNLQNDSEVIILKKQKRKKKKDKQSKTDDDDQLKNQEKQDTKPAYSKNNTINGTEQELDKERCCVKCKAQFPSKNKLFDHLKKTGHSTYINSNNLEKTKKKGIKQK